MNKLRWYNTVRSANKSQFSNVINQHVLVIRLSFVINLRESYIPVLKDT